MSSETFEKARLYGIDKANFEIFKSIICDIGIVSVELYFGFVGYLWNIALDYTKRAHLNADSEIQVACVFLLIVNLIGVVKETPFSVYSTFVLEEKHGFNKVRFQSNLKYFYLSLCVIFLANLDLLHQGSN
jgi:STE24 endopeptidase